MGLHAAPRAHVGDQVHHGRGALQARPLSVPHEDRVCARARRREDPRGHLDGARAAAAHARALGVAGWSGLAGSHQPRHLLARADHRGRVQRVRALEAVPGRAKAHAARALLQAQEDRARLCDQVPVWPTHEARVHAGGRRGTSAHSGRDRWLPVARAWAGRCRPKLRVDLRMAAPKSRYGPNQPTSSCSSRRCTWGSSSGSRAPSAE